MKNWKTTVAGIIIAGITLAVSMGWITLEVSLAIGALATALGFIVSKDGDTIDK